MAEIFDELSQIVSTDTKVIGDCDRSRVEEVYSAESAIDTDCQDKLDAGWFSSLLKAEPTDKVDRCTGWFSSLLDTNLSPIEETQFDLQSFDYGECDGFGTRQNTTLDLIDNKSYQEDTDDHFQDYRDYLKEYEDYEDFDDYTNSDDDYDYGRSGRYGGVSRGKSKIDEDECIVGKGRGACPCCGGSGDPNGRNARRRDMFGKSKVLSTHKKSSIAK